MFCPWSVRSQHFDCRAGTWPRVLSIQESASKPIKSVLWLDALMLAIRRERTLLSSKKDPAPSQIIKMDVRMNGGLNLCPSDVLGLYTYELVRTWFIPPYSREETRHDALGASHSGESVHRAIFLTKPEKSLACTRCPASTRLIFAEMRPLRHAEAKVARLTILERNTAPNFAYAMFSAPDNFIEYV